MKAWGLEQGRPPSICRFFLVGVAAVPPPHTSTAARQRP